MLLKKHHPFVLHLLAAFEKTTMPELIVVAAAVEIKQGFVVIKFVAFVTSWFVALHSLV